MFFIFTVIDNKTTQKAIQPYMFFIFTFIDNKTTQKAI